MTSGRGKDGAPAGRPAMSGMIESLLLVGIGVAAAGALAVWLSGSYDHGAGIDCTAWVSAMQLTGDAYRIEVVVKNTGLDGQIHGYAAGSGGPPNSSRTGPFPPGNTTALPPYVVSGVPDRALLPPVIVEAEGAPGAGDRAVCEVVE